MWIDLYLFDELYIEVFVADEGAEGERGFLLADGTDGRNGVQHVQDAGRSVRRFIASLVVA